MEALSIPAEEPLTAAAGPPKLQSVDSLSPPRPEGGFFNDQADDQFVLVHGEVEVPAAGRPVKYTASVPEVLRSPVAHLIVPGFGGVKRSSRGLRNAMAEQEGLVTISFEPARGGGRLRDLFDAQRVHIDTLSAILQDLPDNEQLRDVTNGDSIDLNRSVLVPHSMGSLAATERARLHPDETQSVIYMGSIGLEANVGLDFVPRLLMSASHDVAGKYVAGKLVPGANRLDLARRTVTYYLCNPVRTIGEIATCLNADIQKPIGLLEVLDIETGVLYFSRDKLVPAKEAIIEKTREMVDICEVMEGYGHLAPQRHPYDVAARLGAMSASLAELDLKAAA